MPRPKKSPKPQFLDLDETAVRLFEGGPLMWAGIGLSENAREFIAYCLQALESRDGTAAAEAALARWRKARQPAEMMALIKADLPREPQDPGLPPHPRLRLLASRADYRELAERFDCLVEMDLPGAGEGLCATYEWLGGPGAVVEVRRDQLFGWTLERARLAGEATVPPELREAIIADAEAIGVHTGPGYAELCISCEAALDPSHDYTDWLTFGRDPEEDDEDEDEAYDPDVDDDD